MTKNYILKLLKEHGEKAVEDLILTIISDCIADNNLEAISRYRENYNAALKEFSNNQNNKP